MSSRVHPPGYSMGLKFRVAGFRLGEPLLVATADVVQVARVTEILADAGHEPAAFRQPDAAAPARRVGRQLARFPVQEGRQLLAARNDQPVADDRQIALGRQAGDPLRCRGPSCSPGCDRTSVFDQTGFPDSASSAWTNTPSVGQRPAAK